MDDIYQQIADGHYQVFSWQWGLQPSDQEQWGLPFLYLLPQTKVVKDGEIDLEWTKHNVREMVPMLTNNLVVVNVERDPDSQRGLCRGRSAWSTSREEWEETAEDIKRIIAAVKEAGEEVGKTLWVSFVLYLPSRFYSGFRHGRCSDYQHGMEWIKWMAFLLAPHLDFYVMGRGPAHAVTDDAREHWGNTDQDKAEWLIHAQATQDSLTEIRRRWPKKPLIPVIYPQWTNAQSKPHYHDQWSFVPADWVRGELNQMRGGLADSVCVWVRAPAWWTDLNPQQAADKFWASEQGFIAKAAAR